MDSELPPPALLANPAPSEPFPRVLSLQLRLATQRRRRCHSSRRDCPKPSWTFQPARRFPSRIFQCLKRARSRRRGHFFASTRGHFFASTSGALSADSQEAKAEMLQFIDCEVRAIAGQEETWGADNGPPPCISYVLQL